MGFFSLRAQCAVCGKTVGLNRYQLSKNVWICPKCKKVALKAMGGFKEFQSLQKMSIDKIKEIVNNSNTSAFQKKESKHTDKFNADEYLQKSKERENLFLQNSFKKFNDELNSIPHVDIQLSDDKKEKRYLKDFEEIEFKRVTRAINVEKLLPFVVVDVETTGLGASSCEIIEFSAIKYETDIHTPTSCMTTLVKSKKPIPEKISEITHITDEMLADKPFFYQIKDSVNRYLKGCNILGHNTIFDLKFLYINGIDLDYSVKYYDALEVAQTTLRKAKTKYSAMYGGYVPDYDSDFDVTDYKLDTICEFFNIYRDSAHRSLSDCYATAKVFNELIEYKKCQ